jgi:hypothetical protein
MAYICSFKKDKQLMEEVKNTWEFDYRDADILQWVKNAESFVNHNKDLRLVFLFR